MYRTRELKDEMSCEQAESESLKEKRKTKHVLKKERGKGEGVGKEEREKEGRKRKTERGKECSEGKLWNQCSVENMKKRAARKRVLKGKRGERERVLTGTGKAEGLKRRRMKEGTSAEMKSERLMK